MILHSFAKEKQKRTTKKKDNSLEVKKSDIV